MRALRALLLLAIVAGTSACSPSTATTPPVSPAPRTWANLRQVTVITGEQALPPPYQPVTTAFTSASDVARVTAALNAYHIDQQPDVSLGGCAGGSSTEIDIVEGDGTAITLTHTSCGSSVGGNLGGDLAGFVAAVTG